MAALYGRESILVVDDEPIILEITKTMLSRYGYGVITANSGHEAVHLFEAWPDIEIDLALVDLNMPEMSGVQFLQMLKRLRPGLPIVLFSGFPQDESLDTIFPNGVPR